MKFSWKAFPLHHQILAGLVLGAIFGALFNVSKYELEIRYAVDGKEESVVVPQWEKLVFAKADTVVIETFGAEDQLRIIQSFRRLSKEDKARLSVLVTPAGTAESTRPQKFENVRGIEKVKTVAVIIKPVGTIFIRLLMFIAIPLVLSSLIVGAASLGDIRRVGKLGGKTLALYLLTTTSAITIGLLMVNLIQPGMRLSPEVLEKLKLEFQPDIQSAIPPINLIDMIVNIVATNPINALASGEMLQIVFFALMIGVSLTMVAEVKAAPVIRFFDGLSETMIKMVGMIMTTAPYGVFALIAATVGEFGFDILETLVWYAATLVLGLILHVAGFLGMLAKLYSGIPIRKLFRGLREVMLVGFTTSSSGATLPVNMKACENNLGVPKKITSFVLPLGATINMDGTAMYQAVAAVFIAQVYQMDLGLAEQLSILLTAVLASIGTAPVPGVGIVMLIIVLRSVNVPEEGIALILGVDRLLDMCRTVANVVGDATVATMIAKSEGVLENKA
ncbi:MAG: dicarboxylate/amino acid:cation symporter [Ignavibacteriales bacterium]|nr:dicarboxylate/amino acid:cation symporter [Ignavibacteriales bacterium]